VLSNRPQQQIMGNGVEKCPNVELENAVVPKLGHKKTADADKLPSQGDTPHPKIA
jgi:hypothetical protein